MPYNNAIPQPNDKIKDSQPQILANFAAIQTSFDINHETFNAGADTGKHKFVTMPEQATAPTTLANEGALYTKESPSSGSSQTELFWRRESNGTEIEISGSLDSINGWCRLPSGLLVKWGTVTGIAEATATAVVFPVGANIPVYGTAPYQVQLTSVKAAAGLSSFASVIDATVTTTGFNLYVQSITGAGSNFSVQYWTIGI